MTTLAHTLDRMRGEKEAKRDPSVTAVLRRATAELAATDILDGTVKVGDPAPLFARPDLNGETVRLTRVLRDGPAVISFFRGRW